MKSVEREYYQVQLPSVVVVRARSRNLIRELVRTQSGTTKGSKEDEDEESWEEGTVAWIHMGWVTV